MTNNYEEMTKTSTKNLFNADSTVYEELQSWWDDTDFNDFTYLSYEEQNDKIQIFWIAKDKKDSDCISSKLLEKCKNSKLESEKILFNIESLYRG